MSPATILRGPARCSWSTRRGACSATPDARRVLSLAADSEDLSGLRELDDTELWKLSLARVAIVDSDLELFREMRPDVSVL